MKYPSRNQYSQGRGVSLLMTLMIMSAVVVLLTIMARLVTVDKRVSAGYSNILRAELAAQAGTADAGNLLLELFQQYPDSVTYWDRRLGATDTPGTVFMFRDLPPDEVYENGNGAAKVYARPLISGAETKEFYPQDNFAETLPATAVDAVGEPEMLSININRPNRFNGASEKGWIGAPPGTTALPGRQDLSDEDERLAIRVPWVEVRDEAGQVVSRYAYWVEDESFKLNVNKAAAKLRGDSDAELDAGTGLSHPLASLQGVFPNETPTLEVAEGIEEARLKLTATGGRMLTPLQIGHSAQRPAGLSADAFGREYRFLLTTDSSALDLSRSGAKRLNLNQVVKRGVGALDLDEDGRPDLKSEDAAQAMQDGVGQIMAAINQNAPRFGQRFYRLSNTDLIAPTPSSSAAAIIAAKNQWDVLRTASAPHEQLYVRKLAANIHDYISPTVNPVVMDSGGQVMVGTELYAPDIWYEMGLMDNANDLAAVGKKRLPYFTEFMLHVRTLDVRNIPATGTDISGNGIYGNGIYEYSLEMDYYLEFWNLSDKDIKPAEGDLGPQPYLTLENQPPISVNNDAGKDGQDVPRGRPFRIKLDEKFNTVSGEEDLVFPAGSVTVITTHPDPWSTPGAPSVAAGSRLYSAKVLYKLDGSGTCSDTTTFSEPPYPPDQEGSVNLAMPNVRRYKIVSFDNRTGDFGEIQLGPNMEGATAMKLVMGNEYGLLDAHPSLATGRNTNNMLSIQPDRPQQYRGGYVSGSVRGLYDPRGSLDAIDLFTERKPFSQDSDEEGAIDLARVNNSSMTMHNGQWNKDAGAGFSHLGSIARTAFASNNRLWSTDLTSITQGAEQAPMVIANGPMQSLGELGHVYDPMRFGSSDAVTVRRRRSGGRTLSIGQADGVWDGTRVSTLSQAEMSFQVSRSREWTAWRLADMFTLREDEELRGDAKAEVEGLYNINGFMRDEGRALRALVQGLQFDPGARSDAKLAGQEFATAQMDALLQENMLTIIPPNRLSPGGNALVNLLSQRLRRNITRRFSPLWERGEISQLAMFDPGVTNLGALIHAGAPTSQINDRGREELCRRLMELITVKGNTYSIYVVGQALSRQGKPIATKAQRVTVRLRPVYGPELDDEFDPESSAEVEARFRAPDAYTLEILNVEDA